MRREEYETIERQLKNRPDLNPLEKMSLLLPESNCAICGALIQVRTGRVVDFETGEEFCIDCHSVHHQLICLSDK